MSGTVAPVAHASPVRVCALIPAFNEAGTIANVITGVRPHVDGIIVVDDGSTDGTAGRAAAALATDATADAADAAGSASVGVGLRQPPDAPVVVLRHSQNRGKGHAVRTGLARLLDDAGAAGTRRAADVDVDVDVDVETARGDVAVVTSRARFTHVLLIDGDMQHRPSDVPALIDAARTTGADLVVGERVFDKTRMPSSRYYSNVIGSWALSGFIGAPVRDSQSGFRLIRLDALRGIPLSATGYEIETEMLIKLARRGARMTGVPVELSYGGAKSKLRPVRDTTRTCFLAVYYRFLSRD